MVIQAVCSHWNVSFVGYDAELCSVWVGSGGQAEGNDGRLPTVQGGGAEDLSRTEEHSPRAQRRWDLSLLSHSLLTCLWGFFLRVLKFLCHVGVGTDEPDSNVDDWEEETIEFFINEEIIPIGDL